MKRQWRVFLACICVFLSFLSCSSAKKTAESSERQEDYEPEPSDGVRLSVPERKNLSYFHDIDPGILSAVERGSPDSLRAAISSLGRKKDSMTESEKVLHYIAVSIMQICWKSQPVSDEVFAQNIRNNYTGAISSARNGFYDPSPAPKDFLSYVLPSLVLAASTTRSDYYQQSLEALRTSISMNPSSVLSNYLLGLLYRRMSDYKSANEYFGTANDLAKNCFECSYAFAETFMLLSDPNGAFALSERLLQIYPQNIELLKLCAESSFACSDLSNAELYVSRVLQIEPENSYYLLFRARILVQKGDYIRAASLLDAYARKDSSSKDYLVLRFEIQRNWNKNISAAKSTIEKAVGLYPDDSEVILLAASLASETGETIDGKSGAALAEKILDSQPDNLNAMQIKIASMVQAQKWGDAYRTSSELVKKDGLPRAAVLTHIKICLSAGKKDEAWRYASRLYSEDSSDEDVLQAYIDVLVSTGRNSEASKLISQLLPGAGTRLKSFLYYERSFLSGDENSVLSDLRSSLTANPRNTDSLFRLYKIYYNKKEYRKAQYYLKQVVALSPKDEGLLRLNRELEDILK